MINLIHGDCLEEMPKLQEQSVDAVITSPPYFNAKDYSRWATYSDYLAFLRTCFYEIRRVLKEGCFFVINTSPVIQARGSRQEQSARYAIPFDIHPIIVSEGFDFIDDIVWVKPEGSAKNRNGGFAQHRKPMGYKPNQVTEYIMVYRNRTNRLLDWNIRRKPDEIVRESLVSEPYERSNVWRINPETSSNHPAPFPIGLPTKIIKYYTFVGDVVLDPFAGSGTTGVACVNTSRSFIGIEKDKTYFDIACKRIEEAQAQMRMM